MINIISTGQLVNFYSSVKSFQEEYLHRNPGVVIASEPPKTFLNAAKNIDKGSAYVLWSNGDMTKEHLTYLQKVEKNV